MNGLYVLVKAKALPIGAIRIYRNNEVFRKVPPPQNWKYIGKREGTKANEAIKEARAKGLPVIKEEGMSTGTFSTSERKPSVKPVMPVPVKTKDIARQESLKEQPTKEPKLSSSEWNKLSLAQKLEKDKLRLAIDLLKQKVEIFKNVGIDSKDLIDRIKLEWSTMEEILKVNPKGLLEVAQELQNIKRRLDDPEDRKKVAQEIQRQKKNREQYGPEIIEEVFKKLGGLDNVLKKGYEYASTPEEKELWNSRIDSVVLAKEQGQVNELYISYVADETTKRYRKMATKFATKEALREQRKDNIPVGTQWIREFVAYKIDRILGLNIVPISVLRAVKGELAVCTEYIEGKSGYLFIQGADVYDKINEIPAFEWQKMALLDWIIGNTDRHVGNFVVEDGTNKLWAIDHGLTFPEHTMYGTLEGYNSFPHLILQRLKELAIDYAYDIPDSLLQVLTPENKEACIKVMKDFGISDRAIALFEDRWDGIVRDRKFPKYIPDSYGFLKPER